MEIFIYVVVLLFSIIIHEVAHGYAAYLRGDDTAKAAGRLTLNPIPHIDIIGTILLPIALLMAQSPVLFGWAKPVPINSYRLKNPKTDIPLVSFAGPLSNILLAVLSGMGIRVIKMMPEFERGIGASIESVLGLMLIVNVVLPVINLVPIPPLDGSKVATYFMPRWLAVKYMSLNQYVGFAVLFLLIWSGVLGKIIYPVISFFVALLSGVQFM
ncbi:MAG: site-2 protease family protein [Endomicrobia bacterium]|nr:site-2 protease family protein [Endomicrobiia bacterium]